MKCEVTKIASHIIHIKRKYTMTTKAETISEQLEFRRKELLRQQEDILNTLNEWITDESETIWQRKSALDNLEGACVDLNVPMDTAEITAKRRSASGAPATHRLYLRISRCGTTDELIAWVDSYLVRCGFILLSEEKEEKEVASEPPKTTLRSQVLEYVQKNPNCSSQEVWKHFKTDSARRTLSDLRKLGLLKARPTFEARRTGSGKTHRYINRYTVKE